MFEREIINYVENKNRVIFYGNVQNASDKFKQLIGIKCTETSVSGELPISVFGKQCRKIKHTPLLCCGEINTVANGSSTYHFPKAEHRECRVFIVQNSGIVSCSECPPVSYEYRRRIKVCGLKNATVRFLAENYAKEDVFAVLNSSTDFYAVGGDFEFDYVTIEGRKFFEARNVSGEMVFSLKYHDKN